MNIERLRRIIDYSAANRARIESKVDKFYAFAGIGGEKEVLNSLQIVRTTLRKKGYLVLELPFADQEIGALCYNGDALGYLVINTSLPKVNANFALCHEVYHVFCQDGRTGPKAEFARNYYEQEAEYAANLFAGMMLMPESNFRRMYAFFKNESGEHEQDVIIRLMNYYQAPYMAVLIRCYELELPGKNVVPEELMQVDGAYIRERFVDLWLDDSCLDATRKDDFPRLEAIVERFGNAYIRDGYLEERTLAKVLQNMKTLYAEIKGV